MMNALYVLIIITHVNSGAVVSFQDFYSIERCKQTAEDLKKATNRVEVAYCTGK